MVLSLICKKKLSSTLETTACRYAHNHKYAKKLLINVISGTIYSRVYTVCDVPLLPVLHSEERWRVKNSAALLWLDMLSAFMRYIKQIYRMYLWKTLKKSTEFTEIFSLWLQLAHIFLMEKWFWRNSKRIDHTTFLLFFLWLWEQLQVSTSAAVL